jgi:hypothetical protein
LGTGSGLKYFHHSPCESYEATRRELSSWWYIWDTLVMGNINTGTWISNEAIIHGYESYEALAEK